MSTLTDIDALFVDLGAPHFIGYADTGVEAPYVCTRPLLIDSDALALDGSAIDWDTQYSVYCAGGSPEASYNLAIKVIRTAHGKRVAGTTLAASMGYTGAQVEGHYESEVTIQLNQGGI